MVGSIYVQVEMKVELTIWPPLEHPARYLFFWVEMKVELTMWPPLEHPACYLFFWLK